MATFKYLSLADVPSWLNKLAEENTVFVPKRENKSVVYRPYHEGVEVELKSKPTESAKHTIFPRSEALFNFYKKKNDDGKDSSLCLEEPTKLESIVVFGALSCDIRGFFSFDPVYSGSGTAGKFQDPYYLRRREKTAFISHACNKSQSTCFCNWVGGGPASQQGVDIVATDIVGGLVLKVITEKGELLAKTLADAEQGQIDEAALANKKVLSSMSKNPGISTSKEDLLAVFDNSDFWMEQSASCLSCGACTYLCPTCYCFNITDESNGHAGTRLRSWDNCMAPLYTLEASGHNPRSSKAARLKNRIGHKFSYYPSLHEGQFSCVGCGRCIKSCPSAVDIRQIVLSAIETAKAMKESANG